MHRVLAAAAALALAACTTPSVTRDTPKSDPAAPPSTVAAAAGDKVSIDLSSTYTDEKTAYYAGQALDAKYAALTSSSTPAQWQAVHAAAREKATSMQTFNKGKGLPSEKIAIYLFETKAPDIQATKGELPDAGMIAVYDNVLTGEWRYCFGGQRTDAGRVGDMKKCVHDADPTSADTYDPSKE